MEAAKRFGRIPIHEAGYDVLRSDFGLPAQIAIGCIAKVVKAYKTARKCQRRFGGRGSITYDSRILIYRLDKLVVSIRTLLKLMA